MLWNISFPWWHLIIRAVVVYFAVLLLLRVGGKRQVGQLNVAQFVALLLISNAVQNAMNGGDNSITGGIILAIVLVALAHGVSFLTYRSRKLEHLIQGRPTLLVHNGRVLHAHLARELLTIYELKTQLRRQGVHEISEVAEAVLESDGFISVLKASDIHTHPELARADDLLQAERS